jgi:hypothetical protein
VGHLSLHHFRAPCYVDGMDCPEYLKWSATLMSAKMELARVEASRPKVRGTSDRFESELERAQHEVRWTKSWFADHVKKCEVCKANGVRADQAL